MKQDNFLFFPEFFPLSLLSPEHVAWLCCHSHRDSPTETSLAALSRQSSPLRLPRSPLCWQTHVLPMHRARWLLIRAEINKLPAFLEGPSPTAGGGYTCSPHMEPQEQPKACGCSSITQTLCKYECQVQGWDGHMLQDAVRAGMGEHASAVMSGPLPPYPSCSRPRSARGEDSMEARLVVGRVLGWIYRKEGIKNRVI